MGVARGKVVINNMSKNETHFLEIWHHALFVARAVELFLRRKGTLLQSLAGAGTRGVDRANQPAELREQL